LLKNLPVHFDDPAFREDALRGIANTRGESTNDRPLSALGNGPPSSPSKPI